MKFKPQDHVHIPMVECVGRINRCILDGGPQPIYQVNLVVHGDFKTIEFFEDELEELNELYNPHDTGV